MAPTLTAFLSGIPIFGGLQDSSVERLVGLLEERRCPKDTVVCRQGELGRALYVIRDGEALVSRESRRGVTIPVARLGPGELFGEMTLIDIQPRSATVTVTRDAWLFELTNVGLYTLYQEDRDAYVLVLQNICRELSRRLRRADERLCEALASADSAPPALTLLAPALLYQSGT